MNNEQDANEPFAPANGSGNQRDPIREPKPGDVWRIAGTDGIILRVEPDCVVANHARLRDGRWQEGSLEEIGVMVLWEKPVPLAAFQRAAASGQLLQRAEDFLNSY